MTSATHFVQGNNHCAQTAHAPHPFPHRTRTGSFEAATRIIDKDLLRTFPTHPWYASLEAPLVTPLRHVLLAFATAHPDVAYCQVCTSHGDPTAASDATAPC